MIEVGDEVVQLINQFTPEQIQALADQVARSKKGPSELNRQMIQTVVDRGIVTGTALEDDGKYYFVSMDLGGPRKRLRKIHERKICLASEYSPSQEVVVPA